MATWLQLNFDFDTVSLVELVLYRLASNRRLAAIALILNQMLEEKGMFIWEPITSLNKFGSGSISESFVVLY